MRVTEETDGSGVVMASISSIEVSVETKTRRFGPFAYASARASCARGKPMYRRWLYAHLPFIGRFRLQINSWCFWRLWKVWRLRVTCERLG